MKVYVVKTLRLKNYLETNGFKKLRERPDRFKKGFSVFLFEDTLDFRAAIDSYSNRNKKYN